MGRFIRLIVGDLWSMRSLLRIIITVFSILLASLFYPLAVWVDLSDAIFAGFSALFVVVILLIYTLYAEPHLNRGGVSIWLKQLRLLTHHRRAATYEPQAKLPEQPSGLLNNWINRTRVNDAIASITFSETSRFLGQAGSRILIEAGQQREGYESLSVGVQAFSSDKYKKNTETYNFETANTSYATGDMGVSFT